MKIQLIIVSALLLRSLPALAMPVVLQEVLTEIERSAASGEKPWVVSDLDETVVDSTTRRLFSYRDAMSEACGPDRSGACGIIAGVNLAEFLVQPNRYEQTPLFRSLGVASESWLASLRERMFRTYLSGRYLELDQAVPGSVEFIQELKKRGARVLYVSSRWDSRQRTGTLASLRDLGLLGAGEDAQVILRPDGRSSIGFKKEAFEAIRAQARDQGARVLLLLENEPENMNAMLEAFPGSAAVFVEGAFEKPGIVAASVPRIRRFR